MNLLRKLEPTVRNKENFRELLQENKKATVSSSRKNWQHSRDKNISNYESTE